MRNLQFLLLILSLHSSIVFGNANIKPKQVKLSGYISNEAIKEFKRSPEIRIFESFSVETATDADITPVVIKDNFFSLTLNLKNDFAYIDFRGPYINSIYLDLFFVEAGDSLVLSLKNNKDALFSGRGSEKLNYQMYVGKMQYNNWKNFNPGDPAKINHYKSTTSTNLKLCFDSLNKMRNILSEKTYELLKVNTTSSLNDAFLASISLNEIYTADSAFYSRLKDEFWPMRMQLSGLAINDPFIINNANIYIQYLYNFEKIFSIFLTRERRSRLQWIYEQFQNNYTGLLREKLIIMALLNFKGDPQIMKYAGSALNLVKDSTNRTLLKTFFDHKTPGNKAYDFSLIDPNGKRVSLQDLKGKVLVIDTWYKGCIGCIMLTKRLKPIFTKFKHNEKVLFISVSVDKEKKTFIDGIKTGLYGSKECLYLYTGGNGHQDPFLLHYKYSSYPNMLIIDKMGNVVSANPPNPVDNSSTQAFINLINENL